MKRRGQVVEQVAGHREKERATTLSYICDTNYSPGDKSIMSHPLPLEKFLETVIEKDQGDQRSFWSSS